MKSYKPFWILMLMIAASNVWAYASSSKKACNKPKFSKFVPMDNAGVAAKSALSFMASTNTNPDSIFATIKDQPVAVAVTHKNQGFQLGGTLPGTLKGNFARITINAGNPDQCKACDGWLLKILEG